MASVPEDPSAVDSSITLVAPAPATIQDAETPKFDQVSLDNEDKDFDLNVPTSETASVASSLFEHVEENGRTYHKYKDGKYVLPNDELEQNRLGMHAEPQFIPLLRLSDLQHHLSKFALHGRLHLAPLKEESVKHALDIATGTGIWAIDFAEQYTDCNVIGSDLSPIQPNLIPANLRFEVDDADDVWVYPHLFDYIHSRFTTLCWADPQSIMQKAFDALNPGGYYEMQDPSAPLRSIDGTLEGTAMDRCGLLMFDAFLKRGVDISAPRRHKAMMEAVGFVDVVETVIQWPIGTWAKSRYHKTIGAWYQKDLLAGVEGMCTALFTRGPGALKKEEVDKIIEEVKGNVLDKSIHAYQDFWVVYGRKPETKTAE